MRYSQLIDSPVTKITNQFKDKKESEGMKGKENRNKAGNKAGPPG